MEVQLGKVILDKFEKMFQIQCLAMDSGEWKNVLNNIQRKGVCMDENILTQSFTDVVSARISANFPTGKGFLKGAGLICDNSQQSIPFVQEISLKIYF